MQISSILSDEEVRDFQQKLYEYFDTGFLFEQFLKKYLLKLGLDEVEVTQATRDGGVDLKAIRKGIGDFSNLDTTEYLIQAKRYAPDNKISVAMIRQLKGVLPDNNRGMFITTSEYTTDAYNEATSNTPRPAIVPIDGKRLVLSCIDNEIGFFYKPVFSKSSLSELLEQGLERESSSIAAETQEFRENDSIGVIEKMITANDVRARIISVPSSIFKLIDERQNEIDVIVNGDKKYTLSINKGRNYFARTTQLFRDFKLISDNGVIVPKICKWKFDSSANCVNLYIV